jgi:hypothetical protein
MLSPSTKKTYHLYSIAEELSFPSAFCCICFYPLPTFKLNQINPPTHLNNLSLLIDLGIANGTIRATKFHSFMEETLI